MSTPCYYCELDPGSCELCIHEVNIEDLLQQAHREGWEQGKKQADTILTDTAWKFNRLTVKDFRDAISAMEYKENR